MIVATAFRDAWLDFLSELFMVTITGALPAAVLVYLIVQRYAKEADTPIFAGATAAVVMYLLAMFVLGTIKPGSF